MTFKEQKLNIVDFQMDVPKLYIAAVLFWCLELTKCSLLIHVFTLSPGMVQSIALSMSVCLSTCITWKLHGQCSPHFLHVVCSYGSVLLWWRCSTLSTSGFVDDSHLHTKDGIIFWWSLPGGSTSSTSRQLVFGRVYQNVAPGQSLLSMIALFMCYVGYEFSEATNSVHKGAGQGNGMEILQLWDTWSELCYATVCTTG